MKIESFDQAHAGRCPGCGMMDKEKNHWTHRYEAVEFCTDHYYPCKPDCKGKQYSLKAIARFKKAIQKDLELSLKTH